MDEKQDFSLDEFECPVCSLLIVEPCTLPCSHSLCVSCALLIQEFTDQAQCPLCQSPFSPDVTIDKELQLKLKHAAPARFEERKEQLEKQKLIDNKKERIELVIGNKHRELGPDEAVLGNKHEWTMFVKAKEDTHNLNAIVKRVTYTLDPTFVPDTYHREEAPYELKMKGQVTFLVRINVKFRKQLELPPLELKHHLSFDGQGKEKNWSFRADLSKL